MYFIVGPLRTGSSLLSRCVDDHPEIFGFCESEINRTLFSPYFLHLHHLRMLHHGMKPLEIVSLLDRKPQGHVGSVFRWYEQATQLLAPRMQNEAIRLVGDKSPDFYLQPALVSELAQNHRLLYSIRDPRAIFRSIITDEDASEEEKQNRWRSLCNNFDTWEPLLDRENLLTVRYESLVEFPEDTMREVYAHLGVGFSGRFLTPFSRIFPSRFLWKTAVDWETGLRKDFDPTRIHRWEQSLSREQVDFVENDPVARRIMDRFGYIRTAVAHS